MSVYIFTKSGSRVHVIGPTFKWNGLDVVEVERLDTGKRMVVPKSALILEETQSVAESEP